MAHSAAWNCLIGKRSPSEALETMGGAMIDTIGFLFRIKIPKSNLDGWGYLESRRGRGFTIQHQLVVKAKNGAPVAYTYLPYVLNGLPLLKVEFSLPHLVLGSNVAMVYNIEQAINLANVLLPDVPGIPKLDLWDGVVCRLDICYNHQVGDPVPYFIQALKSLEYPRRETITYSRGGVVFKNKQVLTKFYGKEKERLEIGDEGGAELARGILREETSLGRKHIKKLAGKKEPILRDINLDMLITVLEEDLKALNLLDVSIGTADTTLEKLIEKYGELEGAIYEAYLRKKLVIPSNEELARMLKMNPRTLERRIAKILEAGIPLTITKSEEPLPPLVIDRELIHRLAEEQILFDEGRGLPSPALVNSLAQSGQESVSKLRNVIPTMEK
jgi:hypothetical protein